MRVLDAATPSDSCCSTLLGEPRLSDFAVQAGAKGALKNQAIDVTLYAVLYHEEQFVSDGFQEWQGVDRGLSQVHGGRIKVLQLTCGHCISCLSLKD
jgi:hypothetical protein